MTFEHGCAEIGHFLWLWEDLTTERLRRQLANIILVSDTELKAQHFNPFRVGSETSFWVGKELNLLHIDCIGQVSSGQDCTGKL